MTDIPNNNALDALRASDQWLRTIVEKIDIDPDKTEFAVDAVSSASRRPLARTTLTERLAANKSVLDAAENAAVEPNETDFDYGLRAFDALTNAVGEAITLLEKVTKRQEQIIQKQDEIWAAMQTTNEAKPR